MIRAAALRVAALAVLGLLAAGQLRAVSRDGLLEDPAPRLLAALGGEAERAAVVAALPLSADGPGTMAALKRDALAAAGPVARTLGVADWRLGNRVDGPSQTVFLDGRTRQGGQVRVVAWQDSQARGVALALVQTGALPALGVHRRQLARALAAPFGVRPSAVATAVEVRGFVHGREPAAAGLPDRWTSLPVAVFPARGGSRVVIGELAAGPARPDLFGEVVW